ncbi:MAG: methyltransferase domain-containing protein [Pseudomonadota bacterium]
MAIDPEDRGGAAMRLAALDEGPSPERAAPAYVATLFDQHAESFETTLVLSLGYAVPERIAEVLDRLGLGPFAHGLDLGCGTGLVGEALEGSVETLEGVDLSEGMLEIADEKELYAALYAGDAVAFVEQAEAGIFDLIIAADVLPYLGAVGPLLRSVARALAPGGVVAVSTETLDRSAFDGTPGWRVGPKRRYAHELSHMEKLLAANGLEVLAADPVTVRYETGEAVPGHLIVAQRAG